MRTQSTGPGHWRVTVGPNEIRGLPHAETIGYISIDSKVPGKAQISCQTSAGKVPHGFRARQKELLQEAADKLGFSKSTFT